MAVRRTNPDSKVKTWAAAAAAAGTLGGSLGGGQLARSYVEYRLNEAKTLATEARTEARDLAEDTKAELLTKIQENERRIDLLRNDWRLDHDSHITLKTEIKSGLDRILEESKESKDKVSQGAIEMRSLRSELDKIKEDCKSCGKR